VSTVPEAVRLRLAVQEERAPELEARVRRLLAPLRGDERAVAVGCGAGALALALAPHVGEVVGVDSSPELLAAARERAPENCTFLEGDATSLPFGYGEFDLVGCVRLLHHVRRPELVVAQLARVARPKGRILLADQLGDVDPMRSIEADRFERAREPSHTRLLPDGDVRALLEANNLVVTASEIVHETRDLERYLDLAGVPEEDRGPIRGLAPGRAYAVEVGWYVARKP
jgi:SAM-dependent methyltransferase